MLGLKRGAVALCPHEKAWETEAEQTMARLCQILGPVAVEMAHVGSTAIPTIQAKPIIDIAVAVDDFDALLAYENSCVPAGSITVPMRRRGCGGSCCLPAAVIMTVPETCKPTLSILCAPAAWTGRITFCFGTICAPTRTQPESMSA